MENKTILALKSIKTTQEWGIIRDYIGAKVVKLDHSLLNKNYLTLEDQKVDRELRKFLSNLIDTIEKTPT